MRKVVVIGLILEACLTLVAAALQKEIIGIRAQIFQKADEAGVNE